jgi:hypothetical protein
MLLKILKIMMDARQEKANREVAALLARIEYKNENPEFVQKMLFSKDYKI